MNTMKKRIAQVLAGVVGLASVATAGVAMASNGDRSGSTPSSGPTPTVVSTDDGRGHDRRGEAEPGDDRGRHNEPGDDHGRHHEAGDDHGRHGENEHGDDHGRHHGGEGEDGHGDNRGPGGDDGDHGDNSGPGSN